MEGVSAQAIGGRETVFQREIGEDIPAQVPSQSRIQSQGYTCSLDHNPGSS